MSDGQMVTATCNGVELPWSFEFGNTMTTKTLPREDICVTVDGAADSGFVIKETIGPAIINTRGIAEAEFAERAARRRDRLSGDTADRRRDDNLRDAFGG